MANPTLVKAFDSNGTNTTPITASKQTDGFLIGETVPSNVHNELFKQSIEGLNKSRNDGLWDWEDPATSDTEYNTGSMIRYLGNIYISLVDLNTETPADDGINWFTIDSVNEAYILEKIKLWQFQKVTITPDANADYTLTTSENTYGRLVLADGSWTATHNIIVDNTERSFLVDNSSGTYTATVKTSAGTGIAVLAGTKVWLLCDGTNVEKSVDLVAEIATASEIRTGTDDTKAVSSKGIKDTILGMGQTWQDFTGSRVAGVVYTNTTGKPIQVATSNTTPANESVIYIGGVFAGQQVGGNSNIIPDGATYSVSVTGGVDKWAELR